MGGLTLVTRPFTLASSILLARLLVPEDFGAVAMAMILLGSSNLFAGLGMEPAVIHSELDKDKVAFHAFMVVVATSLVLLTFVVLNAGWLATVLGDPSIEPIIRVMSLLIVFNSWSLVPGAIAKKDLQFHVIAKASLWSTIVNMIVGLTMALLGFGVWSLVFAQLLGSLAGTIVEWLLAPGWAWLKPVRWDWTITRSLLSYGLQVTSSGLIKYFHSNWDEWLVGRRLGTSSLRYNTKAYDFTNRTITQLGTNVVGGVFFPTYAKIKENSEKLRRAYLQSVQLISTLMFPVAMGFLVTAPLMIPVVVGDKWLPMVTTLQIYSIMILSRPVSANTSSVFNALGMPKFNAQSGLLLSVVMVPLAFLLLPYGIAGVAAAVVIGDFAGLALNLYRINKAVPGSGKQTFGASLPAFAAALAMSVFVFLIQKYLVQSLGTNILTLLIVILVGVVVYGAGTLLFQREFTLDLVHTTIAILDPKGRLARFRQQKEPE
jgi:PST family polysaccharide transporter